MPDMEKVIKGFECCHVMVHDMGPDKSSCGICPYKDVQTEEQIDLGGIECIAVLHDDALAMLKEQEDRHRLEVHNIGNVDIPEGVSEEHFYLVMNNVVEALQHTDKGESYPYEDTGR